MARPCDCQEQLSEVMGENSRELIVEVQCLCAFVATVCN